MTATSSPSCGKAAAATHRHLRSIKTSLRLAALLLLSASAVTAMPATQDPAKTRTYIDHAWGTLTRSMDDCASLTDTKVAGHPVL